MGTVFTPPPPVVDEVATGEISYDTFEADLTPIDTNILIRVSVDPAAPVIAQAATNYDADFMNNIIDGLVALDEKVAAAEIGEAAHDATPDDDALFGYWAADGVTWLYSTFLEIKTTIVSAVANVAAEIHAAAAKASLVDNDEFGIADSAATYGIKKVLWSTIKAVLKTYFDSIYQPLNAKLTSLAALASVANLTAIANLTIAANRMIYKNNAGTITTNGVWVQVQKTAIQSITAVNTTRVSDTHLTFAMAANTKYAIRTGGIFYNTTAAADFRYRILAPASPTLFSGTASYVVPGSSVVVDSSIVAVPSTDTVVSGAGATGGHVKFDLLVQNGANAGNFTFSWGKGAAGAGTTSVLAGCYLEYMIIG